MDFIAAFNQIDKNGDNEITLAEFERFCEESNIDRGMISKWMLMFDEDRSGKISLDEFCTTLGLKRAMVLEARNANMAYSAPLMDRELPAGTTVISTTMKLDDQIDIAEKTEDLLKPDKNGEPNPRECANDLKKFLDERYGRIWHVVICTGSYWMNFSHEPECSFMFKQGRHIILLWRTPGM